MFLFPGEGASAEPCSDNYRGRYAFSEPETRAIANFLWRIRRKLNVYLTLHSYGQYWLTPWGFSYRVPHDYAEMVRIWVFGVFFLLDLCNFCGF